MHFWINYYSNSEEESNARIDELTSEDYKKFMEGYSKKYFDAFIEKFAPVLTEKKWTIIYDKLKSPNEYNYINDQIYIEVSWCDEDTFDAFFKTFDASKEDEEFFYTCIN